MLIVDIRTLNDIIYHHDDSCHIFFDIEMQPIILKYNTTINQSEIYKSRNDFKVVLSQIFKKSINKIDVQYSTIYGKQIIIYFNEE